MGTPSISVSQHQAPKKFAPVVAPKPKFNPYKSGEMHDIAGKAAQTHSLTAAFNCVECKYRNETNTLDWFRDART